jgi:hypothetical protein
MMGCGGREECVEGSRVWTHQKVVGTGVDVSPYEIEVTRDGEGTRERIGTRERQGGDDSASGNESTRVNRVNMINVDAIDGA